VIDNTGSHPWGSHMLPGRSLNYIGVHMRDQKNRWKGVFVCDKARNARLCLGVLKHW
jgi:hypothetical protein